MIMKKSRVVIIGIGNVGVTTAFSLVTQGVCDEVVLIDIDEEKVLGEVLDLSQSIEFLNRNVSVKKGGYEDCREADIVVVTACAPMTADNNRLLWLEATKGIIKSIVEQVMANGFDGHFVVVSNPVDIISYYIYKISGLPGNQIIGTGTSLDSARLKCFIGELIDVDPRSINAYVLGEHGDSEMIPWSCVRVGGKDIYSIIRDNPWRIREEDLDLLHAKTMKAGWEIFNRKGNTAYGIATSAVGIIKAILFNENRIIPVSALLSGHLGEDDVFIGVPVILNRTGAKEIVELEMTEEEKKLFHASCDNVRQYYSVLNV
ncbi:MAG: L-lactate dehydrogenase [Bacillota bacterium]|nr:L-lactate dehydrogenase [Bacillota bacterium]